MIDRLERAFKRQQQFTGDASHELRTPLAVIQAEATLALQKEREAGEYRESLQTISEEAGHMASIIEKLLTLARADSGTEQLMFEEIDLGKLLTEIAADAEVLCQHKGLSFQLGEVPGLTLKGDRARLRELFLNLLDNAIKYTPAGGTVSLSLREAERMATVDVRDTGLGIPPEHVPHIFERFYRVDKARSRAEGGAGLGLAICKHIAEIHGGRIEVQSEAGKGSTFSVRLPLS
ncbi:MAG: two-component sensor histidine kinase, partial [Chloroflexi bacterium]|nr:two-component sensor histidine kinase [Chloroflexota bacterium]